jgi:hypothetical protein
MKISQVKVRAAGIIICGIFLSETLLPLHVIEPLFAAGQVSQVPSAKKTEIRKIDTADDLFIPENYGFIKARFKGASGKTLLYIEDIHANKEAQTNIANIIRHVRNSFAGDSLRLIAVEGAEGRIDPSLLKACPDKVTREKIAGILLAEGYISGAELYSVLDEAPVLLYGIERGDLYAKNLKNFIRVQRIREKGARYVELLRKAFEEIGEKVYPAEVKSLLRTGEQHQRGALPFSAYAAFLQEFYARHADAHPEVVSFYNGLRDFKTFVAAVALEKNIDMKKLAGQRQDFAAALSRKLNKGELAGFVNQSLLYRTGKISAHDFYAYAKKCAEGKRLSLAAWPDLARYIDMVALYARMDGDNLFEEAELLGNLLRGALLANAAQKEFDRQFKQVAILEKMTSLRMTRKDLESYYRNRDDFTPGRFSAFLAKYHYQPVEYFDEYLDLVFSAIAYVEEFYDTALARDDVFFKNVAKKLRGEKSGFGVLITGGFHTEGVKKRLERDGISYVVVAPRAAQSKDSSVYLQRMMEVSPPFARYLFRPQHLAVEVLNAVRPITDRGEQNKEYLNIKEVMLALSIMLSGDEQARGFLPDEIRRFFFEKQARWMFEFKKLKNSEGSGADIITFEDIDRDFKRLGAVFSNINFDYRGIRWIGGTVYVPFSVDLGGTKKSAVFAVGQGDGDAAHSAIEGGSVEKDVQYEIIDEREFYSRIESGGAGREKAAFTKLKDDLSKAVYSERFRLHDAGDALRYLQKRSSDPAVNRVLDFIIEHHVLKDAADSDPFALSAADISRIVSQKYPNHPISADLRTLSADQADLVEYALRLPALTINDMLFDSLEGESKPLVRQTMREMNRLGATEGVQVDFTTDLLRNVFADARGRIYGLQGVGSLSAATELFYEREITVRLVLEGVKRIGSCAMIVEAGASAGEGYYVHPDIRRTSDYDLEVIFEEKGLADKTAHLKRAKDVISRMVKGATFSNGDKVEDLLTMYVFGDQLFKDPSELRGSSEWRELGSLPMLAPKLHLHYALWSNRVMYARKGTAAQVSDVGELGFDQDENRLEGHEYIAYQLEALSKAFIDGNTKPLIKLGLRSVLGAVVSDNELLADFRKENPRMEPGNDGTYQYSEMIYNLAKKAGRIFSAEELELIEWLFYGKVGKNAGITENSREKVAMIERLIYKLFIMSQKDYPNVLAAIADPAERAMREKAYLKKLEYIIDVTRMRISQAREKNAAAPVSEYAGYLGALERVKQSIMLGSLNAHTRQPAAFEPGREVVLQPARPAVRDLLALFPPWQSISQRAVSCAVSLKEFIQQTARFMEKQFAAHLLACSVSYSLLFVPVQFDLQRHIRTEFIQVDGKARTTERVSEKALVDEEHFRLALMNLNDAETARLYEALGRVRLDEELAREARVVRDLLRFEQQHKPGTTAGAVLKGKTVFPRFVSLVRKIEAAYPGFCSDIGERPSEKINE